MRLDFADPLIHEGAVAARDGVPGYSCPYVEGTDEADDWHEGWESYWRPDGNRMRQEDVEGYSYQLRHCWEREPNKRREGDNCGY